MATKLKEFLEAVKATHPDIKLEDLVDDDGTPLPQVLDAYKQAGATKTQMTDLEKKLTQAIDLNQKWQQWGAENLPLIEAGKQARTAPPRGDKGSEHILAVFDDPAYSPLKPVFSTLVNTLQSFADGFVAFQNQYQQDRSYAAKQFEDTTIERLRAKYGDKWDTDKVREYAKKYNINSWDGAYQAMIGETLPGEVASAEKIAREKWEKEAKDKKEAGRTDMGGGGAVSGGEPGGSKAGGLESLGQKVAAAMKDKGFK